MLTIWEFFDAVYGDTECRSYIWTLPDKVTTKLPSYEQMANFAISEDTKGKNIYFSVGLSEKNFQKYERAKNADIIGIPGLWVDIDIAGGHAAENLPPNYQAAKDLLPTQFEPSIVVFSGHGIHAYYLFKEILDTRTEEEKGYATNLLKRLQGAVRQKAQTQGWHVDSTIDLCRVLRVPGTMNRKNGQEIPCEVVEYNRNAMRYNPSDFDDALPEIQNATPTPEPRQERFERRATDGNANLMMANCSFLQYWSQNYRTLPEPVWKAACTNIMRGVNGEKIILPLVKEWQGASFNEGQTLKRLRHYLNDCTPQTCEHIKQELHFTGCADCQNIKSPCAWSLAKIPQAVAKIRAIATPSAENTLKPEILSALAIVKAENVMEYAKFENRCRGRVNLNILRREVKKAGQGNAPAVVETNGMLVEGQQLGDITTQQFVPSTPLNLRIPANFSYGIDGVYEVKKTDYGVKSTLASGQPVIICQKIYNVDTQTEKVRLAFMYYNAWRFIVAKRSEIFSARAIVAMTDNGLNASSESAKYLVKYLQALETANPEIPLIYAVSKIGWRDNTLKEFILPSSTKCKYMIDMTDDGEFTSAFRQTGKYEDWLSYAKGIRKHDYARFMLAASFATPLLRIFNERNFMVYFWGTSGGAKTAAMYFAISVWGEPDKLVRSFYGTTNGIERAAEYSNDFPLAINERQVMTGSNRQDSLESLVYMLEGGKGKVRASKSGLRSMATWRTISLGTGEEPLSKENSVQGIKARLLEVNTYPVLPNDLGKSVYAFTVNNHGTAGEVYIERLLQESNTGYRDVLEARKNLADRLSRDFSDCLEPHIDAIALICTADYFVSQWLFGLSPQNAAQEAYNLAVKIAGQMPTKKEISDTERAWEFVSEWLVSNKKRFSKGDLNEAVMTPEYGFIRDGYWHIFPSYLTEAMERMGFKPNKLLREFANKNLICFQQGKTRTFKARVRYNGSLVYVIKIPISEGESNELF